MSVAKREDKLANAKAQGQFWFESIHEMVQAHNDAIKRAFTSGDETEATRSRIEESVLSVEVCSD